MQPIPKKTRKVEDVLSRLGAKLAAWQVRALYLGAQTSTNLRLGPHHLLEHILGPDPVLGDGIDDGNANIQALMKLWNDLVTEHRTGPVRLSKMRLTDPPDLAQLDALAKRRADEITWFTRGIDAGGDDPMEFGPEGEELLHKLAEASAFLEAYQDVLQRTPDPTAKTLRESGQSLAQLTSTIEAMISDLMTISNGVRRRAIAEYEGIAGGRTDDGVPVQRPVKVGRNEPCPCGSGRKWKRCCGAPSSIQ